MNKPILTSKVLLNYFEDINSNYCLSRNKKQQFQQRKNTIEIIDKISAVFKRGESDLSTWNQGLKDIAISVELLVILNSVCLIDIQNYLQSKDKDNTYFGTCGREVALLTPLYCSCDWNILFAQRFSKLLLGVTDNVSYFQSNFVKICFELLKKNNEYEICDLERSLFLLDDDLKSFGLNSLAELVKLFLQENASNVESTLSTHNCFKPIEVSAIKLFCNVALTHLNTEKIVHLVEEHIVASEGNCSWNFLATITCSGSVQCSDYTFYFRQLLLRLIERALDISDKSLLFSVLTLGKLQAYNITSMSYVNWFSQTFSSESSRPLNTEKKAKFFLSCLTEIIDWESPLYLKVYVNKAAFVPASCHLLLSEFIQIAKARLLSLNESVEFGFFDNPLNLGSAENDVCYLIKQLEDNGKLPQTFSASLHFRKSYYNNNFLPYLLRSCKGFKSRQHQLIKTLYKLGKIPSNTFSEHNQMCQ